MVGDIMDISPGVQPLPRVAGPGHPAFKDGFDLVVCCGVLPPVVNGSIWLS